MSVFFCNIIWGFKDCRILAVHSGDIKKSEDEWNKYFEWFCEMLIKLFGIIRKFDL